MLTALNNNVINYPLVIKPIDAANGVGITVNIENVNKLTKAVELIKTIKEKTPLMISDNFIAEEMFYGNDYRILVLNNEVIACVNRIPAHVIGNGTNTLEELIHNFNTTRTQNYLLKIDEELLLFLKEQTLTLDIIPKENEKIFLRQNANISSGGIAVDYTHTISNRFKKISLAAAKSVNGVFVGIDLFTDDITNEDNNQPYTIIEINGSPDYDIHEEPILTNSTANISRDLLNFIFPNLLKK